MTLDQIATQKIGIQMLLLPFDTYFNNRCKQPPEMKPPILLVFNVSHLNGSFLFTSMIIHLNHGIHAEAVSHQILHQPPKV